MSAWQAWLLFGLPSLILGTALFLGRSPWRAVLGYLVLVAGFVGLATVDRASAAVFGGLLALLYAAGRGGRDEGTVDPDTDVAGLVGTDRPQDAARTL